MRPPGTGTLAAMWNVGGGEVIVIALIALIALGPEQLPSVMRKLGALSAQIRSMTTDLKQEFLSGLDEHSSDEHRPHSGALGSRAPGEPIVPPGYAERRRLDQAQGDEADPTP
jgi:Tat protein translocase TatB subunit